MARSKPKAGKATASKVAVGYCRVSTAGQASEGVSLEAQQARIAAWAQANGFELRGVHVDAGLSGGRADNRPALQAALDEVCQEHGALVVCSLSRLARSVKDTLGIGDRLDAAGADLVSLSEAIDTTSAAGKMVFRMLAVLSEFERDLVVERTTMALAHMRAQGQRTGELPYGFRLAEDDLHLEEDPSEQANLARLRSLRASGLSVRKVADALNAEGVPARDGRWHHTSVWRALRRDSEAA
jgi:DNA invertase Pin-like site-specific DNA recombinase